MGLDLPEQAMGWLPLGLGSVVKDKPILNFHVYMQNGQWFSGPFARKLISQLQGKRDTQWEKVFLLPKKKEVSLEKGEVILHQVKRVMADLLLLIVSLLFPSSLP